MTRLRKLARYSAVSAISSAVSWTILGVLVATRVTTAGWANVVATAAGTVPSFELNRRWVWGRTGSRLLLAEVGPFSVLSFTGLAISTLAVRAAAGWASSAGLGAAARAASAEAANVAAFGSLWVAQYLILDRILFATSAHLARPPGRAHRYPPTRALAAEVAETAGDRVVASSPPGAGRRVPTPV
jgi:putative flippase GtrA